jgi:hypothetical protein
LLVSETNTAKPDSDLPFWKRRPYLVRMTLRELIVAYFQHHTIIVHLVLTVAAAFVYACQPAGPAASIAAFGAGVAAYPLFRHLLHRYVVHGTRMYEHPPRRALPKENNRAVA